MTKFINKCVKIKETIYLLEKPIFKTENFPEKFFRNAYFLTTFLAQVILLFYLLSHFWKWDFYMEKFFEMPTFLNGFWWKVKVDFWNCDFSGKIFTANCGGVFQKKARGDYGRGITPRMVGVYARICPTNALILACVIYIILLYCDCIIVALRLWKCPLHKCVKK